MIDYIMFGLISLSFIFVGLSTLYLFKQREFEDERLINGINSLVAGMMFLGIALLAKAVQHGLDLFNNMDVVFYSSLVELVCVSLMVVFFLVGMAILKEI